jgi:MOSC domain-containing protein YiiM
VLLFLAWGIIGENITSEGSNVNGLAVGEQLRIAPVLLQVSAVCTPCEQLEKVRPGWRREIYGRRGMLCQVLQGAIIRAGDAYRARGSSFFVNP